MRAFFLLLPAWLLFACGSTRKQAIAEHGFGGAWHQNSSTVSDSAHIAHAKTEGVSDEISKNTLVPVSSASPIRVEPNRKENPVRYLNRDAKTSKISRFPAQKKHANRDAEAYRHAKTALFIIMAAGVLYFIGFMLLDPVTISMLMWLDAFDSTLLTTLGVVTVLAIFVGLNEALNARRAMRKSRDFDGSQFVVIAAIAGLAMLASMMPLVVYTLILLFYFFLQAW